MNWVSKNRRHHECFRNDFKSDTFYFRINNFPFHSHRFSIDQSHFLSLFPISTRQQMCRKARKPNRLIQQNTHYLHKRTRQVLFFILYSFFERNLLWQPIKGGKELRNVRHVRCSDDKTLFRNRFMYACIASLPCLWALKLFIFILF
jgi:hypothetical protein